MVDAIVIMAGGVVVKAVENPYSGKSPAHRCQYEAVEHEMWGVGVAENNAPHQKVTNAASGLLVNVQVLSTPGAGTYTRTPGATKGVLKLRAGGGGSGGCPITNGSQQAFSSGGGGGGYTEARIDLPESAPINIGAAGVGGSPGGNGGNGGDTTFNGSAVTALGGIGSLAATAVGSVSSTSGTAGGAAGVGGNIVSLPGGQSPNVLSASLGFVTGQQGGASGFGNTGSFGAGAPGKYAGVSTASPQPGITGNQGFMEVWEYA